MKKQLLFFFMMLLPIVASADAVEINGIYYNLIGKAGQAEVTKNPNNYTGSIAIPESVVFEGKTYSVSSIGGSAFQNCSSLISVTIPNGVISIGNNAFQNCSGLTSVTIGNSVTSIGDRAFAYCRGLTSVTIPNSVTSIGNNVFNGCSGLASVTIGNSVTSIGNDAFYGCSSLTSVTIGNSVTSIGNNAFYGCSCLTSLSIPNSVTSIGSSTFFQCSGLTSVTIGNSVTSIGDRAFWGCSGLTSVHITDIAAWCNINFDDYDSNPLCYAHHLYMNNEEVKDLVIPNSVTSIGKSAFSNCSSLTSVTIPNSVTSIGKSAFSHCSGLTSVNIPNSVTSIGKDAFYNCSGLTSVTIPNNVTSIGDYVFMGCSGLTNVTIGNNVTSIGRYVFYGCSSLTSVTIPSSLTSIGGSAFQNCSSLTSVTIPSSVTSIGKEAFSYCSGLTSVHITDIAAWCNIDFDDYVSNPLYYAHHLYLNGEEVKDLVIPNSVTSIGDYVFFGCSGLTSVTIPIKVTSIGNCAFRYCSGLISVTIGSGVKNIGKIAFAGSKELKDVYCLAENVPNTVSNAFDESYIEYTTLHVPEVSINAYKAAEPWKNFMNIVALEGKNTFVLSYIVDGEVYKSYNVKEGETITPEPVPTKEGYTFSGWSEIPETMPDHDVTVTGSFTINKYKLTYLVDGEEYKSYDVEYNSTITVETTPTKEGYTFSGWSEIPETMPAHDVTVTGTFTINKYKLIYMVDGEEYKSFEVEYHSSITPEADPTKEGYTFSGWSEIPTTMPAKDVIVNGTFTISKYKLVYMVDGVEYRSYNVEYGATITPEAEPIKEGYTFSGWSEIPETMPANDVTITGTFTINKYKLVYMVDGVEYKSYDVEYGTIITPEAEPTKEGYMFSGWSDIPEAMPANDVTVTGTFTINKYKLIYIVDGEEYKSFELDYGTSITPEAEPTKEGYTFSGWSEIPETMPAHDVTITGTFSKGEYKLIYMVDGEVYKTVSYDYGASITPEPAPTKEGYTFSGWSDIPETMPANDVTVTGSFTINKYMLTYYVDGEEYKSFELEYGSSITPEAEPSKEGYTFSGWSYIPSSMPAEDVTVYGTFIVNKYTLNYMVDGEVYMSYNIEYGTYITPEAEPTKEGYSFSGWSEIPETMPANDVTVTGTFTINKYKITYVIDGEVYLTEEVEYGSTITPPTPSDHEGYDFAWDDYPDTMPAKDITIYGSYTPTGIEAILASEPDVKIFTVSGKPLNKLQKGVNILRYKDGRTRKIVVK